MAHSKAKIVGPCYHGCGLPLIMADVFAYENNSGLAKCPRCKKISVVLAGRALDRTNRLSRRHQEMVKEWNTKGKRSADGAESDSDSSRSFASTVDLVNEHFAENSPTTCGEDEMPKRVAVWVDVDGEQALGHFDKQPTEEELTAFRELVRAARVKLEKWASEHPELAQRQQETIKRINERAMERMKRENGK